MGVRRRVAAGVVCAALCVSGLGGTAAAAEPDGGEPDALASVDAFEDRLEQAVRRGEAGARHELADWRRLSAVQRETVVRVADDPAFVGLVASGDVRAAAASRVSPHLRVTSGGGERSATNMARGAVRTTTSWHWFSYEVLGVTITKVRQDFTYRRDGRRVRKLLECRHSSVNYAPTRSLSGRTSTYRSAGKGYCTTVWTISYGVHLGSWGVSIGHRDATQTMVVHGNGTHTARFR